MESLLLYKVLFTFKPYIYISDFIKKVDLHYDLFYDFPL